MKVLIVVEETPHGFSAFPLTFGTSKACAVAP
jgi:hypothetical protein